MDQKAINQLMQSSPEYRQRALCENCERLEKRIKVLEDALRALYEHSRRSRFKADAYLWEQARAALEVKP